MTTRRKRSADYSIGYGKPPAETRFQKGISGNPKGRPKGKKNMNTIVRETLFGPIQIQQNGRTTTVTALEAILLKMRNNALSGDFRSAAHALQLASRCAELEESRHPDAEVDVFDPQTMVEMMRDYLDHKDSSENNDTETPSKTGDQGDEE